MITALAVLAALAAGYGIGRWRPYDRLADWANWQVRFRLHRWNSRPRQAALFSLLLVTDPVRTVDAWRHRHDPSPSRGPTLTFAPECPQKRSARPVDEEQQ